MRVGCVRKSWAVAGCCQWWKAKGCLCFCVRVENQSSVARSRSARVSTAYLRDPWQVHSRHSIRLILWPPLSHPINSFASASSNDINVYQHSRVSIVWPMGKSLQMTFLAASHTSWIAEDQDHLNWNIYDDFLSSLYSLCTKGWKIHKSIQQSQNTHPLHNSCMFEIFFPLGGLSLEEGNWQY